MDLVFLSQNITLYRKSDHKQTELNLVGKCRDFLLSDKLWTHLKGICELYAQITKQNSKKISTVSSGGNRLNKNKRGYRLKGHNESTKETVP